MNREDIDEEVVEGMCQMIKAGLAIAGAFWIGSNVYGCVEEDVKKNVDEYIEQRIDANHKVNIAYEKSIENKGRLETVIHRRKVEAAEDAEEKAHAEKSLRTCLILDVCKQKWGE